MIRVLMGNIYLCFVGVLIGSTLIYCLIFTSILNNQTNETIKYLYYSTPNKQSNNHSNCIFIYSRHNDTMLRDIMHNIWPNAYFVLSSLNTSTLIEHDRIILIQGNEKYKELWIKTKGLWEFVGTHVNTTFSHCKWFFKMDTDTFVHKHMLTQITQEIYNPQNDHYIGYFGWGDVTGPIGAFYGFSQSIMQKWMTWNNDGKFVWGTGHKGEDNQIWGRFDRIEHIGQHPKFKKMSHKECFLYAHKVPIDWLQKLADAEQNNTFQSYRKCELLDRS
eukprot:101799_1